jgi:hypothetical protein
VVLFLIHEGTLMEISIDKNFPMPEERGAIGKVLAELDVGDSFEAPEGFNVATIRRAASEAGKKLGRKFTVRTAALGLVARVWRVA